MSDKPELWWQHGDSQLPESPVWSPAEQAFYWVDIAAQRIRRHDGSARPARSWALPQKVGCIAPRAGGGFIAALQDGVYAVTLDEGDEQAGLQLLAAAPHGKKAPLLRFNDGRCDRQGRFWVGSMHDEAGAERRALGALARLDAAGGWQQPAFQTGMLVPNGLGFAPDGGRMYFSDSHASRATVWACDYDIETGRPGAPQVFIPALPAGRPDGAAVDAEGGYWICANDGAAVFRYRPDGGLDRRIELPVTKPTMCAFGGADLRLLLIATMKPEGTPPRSELDGALFAVRLDIPGLNETPCPDPTNKETNP